MAHNGTIVGDEESILASAGGAAAAGATEQAGADEPTARRWRRDADFRRAVLEAQDRMFDRTRGRLVGLGGKAAATLERLTESDKPAVALGAAKAVLELGPRLREFAESEEWINFLEDRGDENSGNETPAVEEELIQALAAGVAEENAGGPADAGLQRAVSRARGWLLRATVGRLAALASKAVDVLERLMESDQPSVVRRAAKAVLLLGPRLREATELKARLSRLEEADGKQTAGVIDDKPVVR